MKFEDTHVIRWI